MMLSWGVLVFIAIWVSPPFFMVLYHYDTAKYNWINTLIPVSLLFSPISFIYAVRNPVFRLFFLYIYSTMFLTFFTRIYYNYNLTRALSVSAMSCLLASYYWEVPWLIRNAVIVGFETDWFLHLFGGFFVWFLYKNVGFKNSWKTGLALIFALGLSAYYMFYSQIPPFVTDALVWNSKEFIFIRLVSIISIYFSLNLNGVEIVK